MLDANDRIRTASQQIDIDRSHPEYSTHTDHKVNGSLGAPTVPPDPTAPTLVSATATTLTIEWTHPGDGGSPLIRNFVHYRVEGTTEWSNWYAGETPVTRAVITNLEAATAYDVRVHATNAIGNSSWVQSATAFSTLVGGTASCPVPTFTGRRKIWTGVLTMGDFTQTFPARSFRGYTVMPDSGDGGGLDPVTFTLGSRDYEVGRIALLTSGASVLTFVAGQGDGAWWDSTVLALRLHVCNTNFDFSDSGYIYTDEGSIVIESNHRWDTDLDWSGVTTRTVHMSLPLNHPATGAPVITGPATVGKVLAVDVTGIEDEDGLHDVEYTYQWVRVDADGTSNEADITAATAATYTLTDDDLGKKVKIEVSFPDDFGSDEQRTSAPTETVAGAPNTPATGAPTITGTAQVGETLTAVTTGIMDADGLTSVSYSYQWIRVDADGTSNPADITDETDATYTLVDADLGKKIKVRVTFDDDASHTETLTSAATETVPGVTVSKTALTVTEEDTTGDSYTVVLDSQPTATVTVTVAGHAGTDVTPSPTSLTFTPTNWGTAQTVTVTAGDDADTANESVSLTHSAASTDSEYQGITIAGVAVTVTDNDALPGVTVSTPALTVTEEDTAGDSYTVVLDSQPTATVTVTVAGHAGTDVTLTPSSATLTFTPTNWGTAQTVTVTAGHDPDTANESVSLTHSAASTDSEYQGITIDGVAVTVTDNDAADPAVCAVPSLSGRNVIWTGAMTVAADPTFAGVFGFERERFGSLDDQTFTVGANDYTTQQVSLMGTVLTFGTTNSALTAGEQAVLRLHVCAADLDFSAAPVPTGHHAYLFSTPGLSWSSGSTITLRLSLPAGPPPPPPPVTDLAQVLGVGVVPGNAQLVVTWTAVDNATGYTVQWKSGSQGYNTGDRQAPVTSGSTTSYTIPGLTTGTEYTVRVIATRTGATDGPPSDEMTGTPFTTPGAPQHLSGVPGDAQVTLTWDAPSSDGGSAILRYEYAIDDSGTWIDAGLDLEETVPGLTNGQQYAFEVRAVNSAGPGAPARTEATPLGMPSVPESLTATGGDGEVVLEWTEPADDGGSPVTGYGYRYAAGQAVPEDVTWRDAGTELTATVSGLENETRYTFEVRARNRVGPGETSGTTALPLRLRAELFSTAVLATEGEALVVGVRRSGRLAFPAHAYIGVTDDAFPGVTATEEGRDDGLGRHRARIKGCVKREATYLSLRSQTSEPG